MSGEPTCQTLKKRIRELEHEIALSVGAEKALEERLQFDQLLLDISANFVNLPAREVDREIENGLRRLVEALGVDRSTLFESLEGIGDLRVSHSWAKEGLEPLPNVADARVIAATNRNLEEGVRQGRFRRDLYYRLNGG